LNIDHEFKTASLVLEDKSSDVRITLKLHSTFGTIGNAAADENALKSCWKKIQGFALA